MTLGDKVEVYRNLHKKCWSVRHKGKVIAHVNKIVLKDCQLVVQPAGNARARREQRKNVHAFIRGHVSSVEECNAATPNLGYVEVHYNPFKNTTFVDERGNTLTSAKWVDIDDSIGKIFDICPIIAFD